jgi:transcriptional regulator with XRE-family HTH domain
MDPGVPLLSSKADELCSTALPNCYCKRGQCRAILRLSDDDRTVLERYCSGADCCAKLGISTNTLSQLTSGKSAKYDDGRYYLLGKRLNLKYEQQEKVVWGNQGCILLDAQGNFQRRFSSANEAGQILGLNRSEIGTVCNGELSQLHE